MLETAVRQLTFNEVALSEEGIWIEALPAKVYQTPQYGNVPITLDKLERMVNNFKANIRGQEIATDYDHGYDRARGNEASGWYRDFAIKPSSSDPTLPALYANIEFTEQAIEEIKAKKWKYFSLMWDDEWMDNDGNIHADVVTGGGVTNRPIAKGTMPINFSEAMWEELDNATRVEFAVWSTAFINDLPDSSFLYIESGGKKEDGKTVPRTNRHFPYKDSSGKIDLPHLRNAIARIPQAGGWLSSSLKSSLQAKARRLLGGANRMSELIESSEEHRDTLSNALALLEGEGLAITDESKEWEHSEPGTGTPPEPRKDEDGSDDPAIKDGWRRDTPPIAEPEGRVTSVPEFNEKDMQELRRMFDVPVDAEGEKVVEAARLKFGELDELKKEINKSNQRHEFAEKYPELWEEHNDLMERTRTNSAMAFSESVKTLRRAEGYGLKDIKNAGLSMASQEKIREVHKKFSEGKGTIEDFEEVLKTIMNGGIVSFGEVGTSKGDDQIPEFDASTAPGVAHSRKVFAEVIAKIQREKPELNYREAMAEAAKQQPELSDAWATTLNA